MTDSVVVTEQILSVVTVEERTVVTETVLQVVTIGIQGEPGSGGGGGGSSENWQNFATSTTLTTDDSNSIISNNGATALVTNTLPAAADDLKFTFLVTDGDGIKVKAATGDIIRLGTSATASAGSLTATKIGSTLTLYGKSGTWYATASTGVWGIDL